MYGKSNIASSFYFKLMHAVVLVVQSLSHV